MIGIAGTFHSSPRLLRPRFVQTVVSPRARGLSVRLDLAPDGHCNFDCQYCEVKRTQLSADRVPDIPVMMAELEAVLDTIAQGRGRELPGCNRVPDGYLHLGHVALSGEGEPTLCPCFADVLESLLHLRARTRHGFFRIAIVTNGTRLSAPEIRESLSLLTPQDEIWAKLDAGTEEWFQIVNRSQCSLQEVLAQLKQCGKEHALTIQSLFPTLPKYPNGPPPDEIEAYVDRLIELKEAKVRIPLVQIYSTSRSAARPGVGHAPLATLSAIARQVRTRAGLNAQVY